MKTPKHIWQEVLLHWERLLFNPWIDEPTSQNCALCDLYIREKVIGINVGPCRGCPIAEESGEYGCDNTPYGFAAARWENIVFMLSSTSERDKFAIWLMYKYLVKLSRKDYP